MALSKIEKGLSKIKNWVKPKDEGLFRFFKLGSFHTDKETQTSFMLTEDRIMVGGVRIELPPVVLCSSDEKMRFFSALSREMTTKLSEETGVQFFVRRKGFREKQLVNQVHEIENSLGDTELDGVFKEMYKERAGYVKSTGANSFEIYLFFWKNEILKAHPFASSKFKDDGFDLYEEKLAKLMAIQQDILEILDSCSCAGKYIKTTRLSEKKLQSLMFEQLCPTLPVSNVFNKEKSSRLPEEVYKQNPELKPLTLREQLIHSASYDAGFIEHDGQYSKVLTLREYPPSLNWNHFEFINSMRGDFHISFTLKVPSQGRYKSIFGAARNLVATSGTAKKVEDHAKNARMAVNEKIAYEIEVNKNKIVMFSYQIVLNGYDIVDLDWRSQKVIRSFSEEGLALVAEDYTHHEQYFNTLPGLGYYQNRVIADMMDTVCTFMPYNFETPDYDNEASFVINNKLGHLSTLNLKTNKVTIGNGLVMATSGEGKSVLLASILCNIVLSGPHSGNVIILDYAGEESGYKNLCSMTGGKFVNLMKKGEYSLNPFLAKDVIIENGQLAEEKLTQMINMVEIATAVDNKTMKDYLFEPIVKTALENLYTNWSKETPPIFSDLLTEVEAIEPDEYFKRHHLDKIREEIYQLTNSKISWLVNNNRNPVQIKDRFTIIDIKGFDLYPQKEQDFIAYVVTSMINDAMSAKGRKYVFMDEVGRYLYSPRLQKAIETLYTTARKYDCPVLLINQTFEKFANSEICDAIMANIGNLFLLRQADPQQADQIIKHFQFDDTVAAFYKNLPSVSQNKYSTILWKHGTEFNVVELKLSPFEYELMTSDPKDRAALERLKQQNPDMAVKDVLRLRAEERLLEKKGG